MVDASKGRRQAGSGTGVKREAKVGTVEEKLKS